MKCFQLRVFLVTFFRWISLKSVSVRNEFTFAETFYGESSKDGQILADRQRAWEAMVEWIERWLEALAQRI